jgi:glycosyltransferase involved in cell wall biosynthesis
MPPPVFSIITVTYNAEQWLERTIKSIVGQSYAGIEYIIIDGNSKDGTLDIVRQYQSHINHLVSEPDTGLYDAMNKGLAQATGDYVWFINAGDMIYDENTVQKIVHQLNEKQLPDIIYGEMVLVDAEKNSLGMQRLKAPEKLTWKSFRMGMLVCHQSFIVKKKIAPNYDLTYKFSSDIDWCIRCMKTADAIFNTHLILSRFLDAGISAVNRKEALKERYAIMCKFYGKIPTQIRHLWFAIRFILQKK